MRQWTRTLCGSDPTHAETGQYRRVLCWPGPRLWKLARYGGAALDLSAEALGWVTVAFLAPFALLHLLIFLLDRQNRAALLGCLFAILAAILDGVSSWSLAPPPPNGLRWQCFGAQRPGSRWAGFAYTLFYPRLPKTFWWLLAAALLLAWPSCYGRLSEMTGCYWAFVSSCSSKHYAWWCGTEETAGRGDHRQHRLRRPFARCSRHGFDYFGSRLATRQQSYVLQRILNLSPLAAVALLVSLSAVSIARHLAITNRKLKLAKTEADAARDAAEQAKRLRTRPAPPRASFWPT